MVKEFPFCVLTPILPLMPKSKGTSDNALNLRITCTLSPGASEEKLTGVTLLSQFNCGRFIFISPVAPMPLLVSFISISFSPAAGEMATSIVLTFASRYPLGAWQ